MFVIAAGRSDRTRRKHHRGLLEGFSKKNTFPPYFLNMSVRSRRIVTCMIRVEFQPRSCIRHIDAQILNNSAM